MTAREIVLEQIHHRETFPIPFTLGFEGDVEQRLDEYYGGKAWQNWLTPYIVSLMAVDTVREEQISDSHTRDIFGGIWRNDRRPFHLEQPALIAPSFENYIFPDADAFLDDDQKKSAQKAFEDHPESFRVAVIGWGLFEQSWRIRGFDNALMDAVTEPNFYKELLGRLTELYLDFVNYCSDLPADAIMFGDDWGDQRGVILGPERWREFLKPCWAKVYEAVHAQGKFVISHGCGSVLDIMPDIIEIGMDVFESVQPEAAGMNPYDLKKKWGDRIVFWGCLGSQSTIPFGTPEQIKTEVRLLCKEMGRGGGYILSPAKALQPETPTENAAAVVEAFTNQERD